MLGENIGGMSAQNDDGARLKESDNDEEQWQGGTKTRRFSEV